MLTGNYRRKYSGVRVVVLGSTGFIGRWVARALCDAGALLTLPVRNRSAAAATFEAYGIFGDICDLDLRDARSLRTFYRDARPSMTFNLAGYGVDSREEDKAEAYRINAELVGELCSNISEVRDREWSGLDVVHAGSAMEYGAIGGPLFEDSVANPTTLYGRSKLAGTNKLSDCCRRLNLKAATARLFSVYGFGEMSHRLLPSLISASQTERPIPLTAGLHKRDFVYVEDAARSILMLGLTRARGEAANVATGVLSSVRSFVETAAEALDIERERLQFGLLPTRPEEMEHEPVSVRRLRGMTGWIPNTAPADGIRKTVILSSRPIGSAAVNNSGKQVNTYARSTS